jgi:hypothetical protein
MNPEGNLAMYRYALVDFGGKFHIFANQGVELPLRL